MSAQNKRRIRLILDLFHKIERQWDNEPDRRSGLVKLRQLLLEYDASPDVDLPFITRLHKHIHLDIELPHLCGLLVPVEREHEKLNITDKDFLVTTDDGLQQDSASPMPLSVVLDNIRSAFNVGGIFRTAECLGVQQLHLCGYTATPDNPKVLRSAMCSQQNLSWDVAAKVEDVIADLRRKKTTIVALETVQNQPTHHEVSYAFPCAVLVGNERFGLSEQVLSQVDHVVSIPTYGQKNSLNVVSAFSVCAYEIRRQWNLAESR